MTKKLTPWFPADQKPVRRGVYKTELRSSVREAVIEISYSYWDGANWGNSQPTPEKARSHFLKNGFGNQNKPWCGLAADPKTGGV